MSGAIRHVTQARTGRRVAIVDAQHRRKDAIVSMLRGGLSPVAVARALDLPLATVCRLALIRLRADKKSAFSR